MWADLKPTEKVYACCESRDWILLRSGKAPPKGVETKFAIPVKTAHEYYDNTRGIYRIKHSKASRDLHLVRFAGGHLLGPISRSTFAAATNISLHQGGVFELLPAHIEALKRLEEAP